MKKAIILLMALALCICFSSCKSAEAQNAEALISGIGAVTADSGAAISKAQSAYDALSEKEQESVENFTALQEAQAAYVDVLIESIGQVTLDSEAAISAAEEAYNGLSGECKALVTKAEVLSSARTAYDEQAAKQAAWEALQESIVGVWVHELYGYSDIPESLLPPGSITVPNDILRDTSYQGTQDYAEFTADGKILNHDGVLLGYWSLNEDGTSITAKPTHSLAQWEMTIQIIEEGGFQKLLAKPFDDLRSKKERENSPFGYVKQEDYLAALADKYEVVEVTAENIRDYVGEPVNVGIVMDAEINSPSVGFVHTSPALEKGLVYLGDDVRLSMDCDHDGITSTVHTTLDMVSTFVAGTEGVRIGDTVRGKILYIRQNYVAENYINEDGARVIVMTNGVTIVYICNNPTWDTFWNRTDAKYEDYIY